MESLKYKIINPHLKSKNRINPSEKERVEDSKFNSEIKVKF
jgi:hypothetical protein